MQYQQSAMGAQADGNGLEYSSIYSTATDADFSAAFQDFVAPRQCHGQKLPMDAIVYTKQKPGGGYPETMLDSQDMHINSGRSNEGISIGKELPSDVQIIGQMAASDV